MAITTGANLPAVSEDQLEEAREKYIAKTGRPSTFSFETAVEILVRLEEGESLQAICRDDHLPAVSTVYDWKRHIPAFALAFTRTRQNAAASMVDDGLSLLDGLDRKTDKDGNPVPLSMTTVRLAEMRARYRMELAKCYDRDTYGDKQRIDQHVQVEHTVGGVIAEIMGQTKPLVCIEAEETPMTRTGGG